MPTDRQQPLCERCLDYDQLAAENANLTDEISGLLKQVRKLSRENTGLRNQLNGEHGREPEQIKELCSYHDQKYREQFPRSPGLDYPMDGANAKAFRKALRMSCMVTKQKFDLEDLKHCIDGLFLSDFHVSKATYCRPPSFLENENKIRQHIQRWEDFTRLVESGFDEAWARRLIHAGVDKQAHRANELEQRRCRGCGRDPLKEGCWCSLTMMERKFAEEAA